MQFQELLDTKNPPVQAGPALLNQPLKGDSGDSLVPQSAWATIEHYRIINSIFENMIINNGFTIHGGLNVYDGSNLHGGLNVYDGSNVHSGLNVYDGSNFHGRSYFRDGIETYGGLYVYNFFTVDTVTANLSYDIPNTTASNFSFPVFINTETNYIGNTRYSGIENWEHRATGNGITVGVSMKSFGWTSLEAQPISAVYNVFEEVSVRNGVTSLGSGAVLTPFVSKMTIEDASFSSAVSGAFSAYRSESSFAAGATIPNDTSWHCLKNNLVQGVPYLYSITNAGSMLSTTTASPTHGLSLIINGEVYDILMHKR